MPVPLFSGLRARLASLRGRKACWAAFGLGVLSAFALPPLHILPVLLLALPGLLVLLDSAASWRTAFWRGLWFAFGLHLCGLYWITDAILIEAADYWWFVPLAVPALSMFMALFVALPCAVARLVPAGGRRVLLLAGAWVLGDLARQFVGTGFPWNPWGADWAMPGMVGDVFIQPAAWIGVQGLTLCTVLLAAVPYVAFYQGRRAWIWGGLGLLAWAGAGEARLRQPVMPVEKLTVVLVQGNVSQGRKWDLGYARGIFTHYLDLTQQGVAQVTQGPSVVVWPESSFPGVLEGDDLARQAILQAAWPARAVMVGSVRFPQEPEDGVTVQPRNSLLALTPDGQVAAVYDKWHLVPGGEYAPTWLPFAVKIVPGGGFARGDGPHTLHVPGVPAAGPLICYEAVYAGQIMDRADRPDWMVNITNDAWFGNSSGPRQHLTAVRLRAVEEGLPMMRAANTGISAAFDAHGHELARLGMNRAGVLTIQLTGKFPPTLFSRFGLLIPFLLALTSIGLTLTIRNERGITDVS